MTYGDTKTDSRTDAGTVFSQSAVKTKNSVWHTTLLLKEDMSGRGQASQILAIVNL